MISLYRPPIEAKEITTMWQWASEHPYLFTVTVMWVSSMAAGVLIATVNSIARTFSQPIIMADKEESSED